MPSAVDQAHGFLFADTSLVTIRGPVEGVSRQGCASEWLHLRREYLMKSAGTGVGNYGPMGRMLSSFLSDCALLT